MSETSQQARRGMPRIFRRLAAITGTVVVLGAAAATNAYAWHAPLLVDQGQCVANPTPDKNWMADYTAQNPEKETGTIEASSIPALVGTAIKAGGQSATVPVVYPASVKSATEWIKVVWPSDHGQKPFYSQPVSEPVGGCTPALTKVTPVKPTPTGEDCTHKVNDVMVYKTPGVLYLLKGVDVSGQTIQVMPSKMISIQPVAAKGSILDKEYGPYIFSNNLDLTKCTTHQPGKKIVHLVEKATPASCGNTALTLNPVTGDTSQAVVTTTVNLQTVSLPATVQSNSTYVVEAKVIDVKGSVFPNGKTTMVLLSGTNTFDKATQCSVVVITTPHHHYPVQSATSGLPASWYNNTTDLQALAFVLGATALAGVFTLGGVTLRRRRSLTGVTRVDFGQ